MICQNCNKGIPDDSVFCPNCGCKIGNESSPEAFHSSRVKMRKKLIIAIPVTVVVVIGLCIGTYINSTPSVKYSKAEKAFENGNYERAIKYYTSLGNYKDAANKLATSELANHYSSGVNLLNAGDYVEAKSQFELSKGYEDSVNLIKQCNYGIAENYIEAKYYLSAAKSFKTAGDYKDANDRILDLGYKLFTENNYKDAVKVYEYAKNWSSDPYAQYANGKVNLDAQNYDAAATYFKKAGNILDSQELYNEAQYAYASQQFKAGKYKDAKKIFEKISNYNDAASLINACDLMTAKEKMDNGYLNTAKASLEQLPNDYTYDDISVSTLLSKLNANSQWLSICGKWTSTGGQMRTTQNGSYGYSHWWYRDFESGDEDIEIRCKLSDDGKVTVITSGTIPIYTNYSTISAGLNISTQSVSVTENVSSMGNIKINDFTSLSLSASKISVSYKQVDNSHDVYFSYTYKTDVTYGKRTNAY